jgi:hypothetical protein
MLKLELVIDDTCKNKEEFKGITSVEIEKQDIFNYGVFHYEVPPEKIGENDFEYLQSKVPAYYLMYNDQIDIPANKKAIICKVPGEAAQNVSELVGIAVGLRAASSIFKIQKKDIQKIGLSIKKEKRLDFKAKCGESLIEIETKGTTWKSSVDPMIKDIHAKKKGKSETISRYGFVTLLRKVHDQDDSKLFATDPEVDDVQEYKFKGIYEYINYYLIYFSFILDNPQYNKLVRVLKKLTDYRKPILNLAKMKYKFSYKGKMYYGQCFDKRLIKEFIDEFADSAKTIKQLFIALTNNIGEEKYFLGIELVLINLINNKDVATLSNYLSKDDYAVVGNNEYIKMSDGILFIRSRKRSLPEMERQFTEEDVKARLAEVFNYTNNERHECGAPCTSREKEGKPCEIKTYRGHCHFHR